LLWNHRETIDPLPFGGRRKLIIQSSGQKMSVRQHASAPEELLKTFPSSKLSASSELLGQEESPGVTTPTTSWLEQ